STVMELSEILVTLPMTCFSFPCARAKTESAKYQVTTAMARFILLLSNCDALVVWVADCLVDLRSRTVPLLAPPVALQALWDSAVPSRVLPPAQAGEGAGWSERASNCLRRSPRLDPRQAFRRVECRFGSCSRVLRQSCSGYWAAAYPAP